MIQSASTLSAGSLKQDRVAEAISGAALWASLAALSCDRFVETCVAFSCCNSLMKNTIREIAYGTPQRRTREEAIKQREGIKKTNREFLRVSVFVSELN